MQSILCAALLTLLSHVSATSITEQQPSWVGSPDGSTITVHINTPAGQAGPILNNPFTGIEVRSSQQKLSDGTTVTRSDTSKFYRDGEGRMRVQGTNVVIIFDPTIDSTFTLHIAEKTYDQFPAGGGKQSTTIAAYGNSNHINSPGVTAPIQNIPKGKLPHNSELVNNVVTLDLGNQSINGVLCRGTRITMSIPANSLGNDREIHVVNERWYSDTLKVLVKSTNDDPRFGKTTYDLKDIRQNDPDPKLFKLPEGFIKQTYR